MLRSFVDDERSVFYDLISKYAVVFVLLFCAINVDTVEK